MSQITVRRKKEIGGRDGDLNVWKFLVTKPVLLLMASFISTLAWAQNRPVNATIDGSETGAPISKYIYGQFLEHIGGIVNNGIWADFPTAATNSSRQMAVLVAPPRWPAWAKIPR